MHSVEKEKVDWYRGVLECQDRGWHRLLLWIGWFLGRCDLDKFFQGGEGIGHVNIYGKNISAGIDSQGSFQGRHILPGTFKEAFVAGTEGVEEGH